MSMDTIAILGVSSAFLVGVLSSLIVFCAVRLSRDK